MRKTAVVFPGQGSQFVGMGKELWEASRRAREFLHEADHVLGFPLSRLCLEGPVEDLNLTANTQPAVLAVSVALYEALYEEGLRPWVVAGHSLGEYTALVAARSLGFGDACRLVAKRGRFMQEAFPPGRGGMMAVIGMDRYQLGKALEAAKGSGPVEAVNFNCPGQVVISGEVSALERASEVALAMGARRVIRLDVSGPFHSSLMQPAAELLRQELRGIRILPPALPIVGNVSGDYLRTPEEIREELARQVASPVLWEDSIRRMWEDGVQVFVEVGPSAVLGGLIKRTLPKAEVISCDVRKPLNLYLEMLKGVLLI